MWIPPGAEPDADAIVAVLTQTIPPEKHDDIFSVLELMDAVHPTYEHWYLPWLGVDRARTGAGLGSELLAQCLAVVADGLPAFLETPIPERSRSTSATDLRWSTLRESEQARQSPACSGHPDSDRFVRMPVVTTVCDGRVRGRLAQDIRREVRAELGGDEAAIRGVVSDYVDGWFDGDGARMERALHPEFVKRCRGTEGDSPGALVTVTAAEMIDSTKDGMGRRNDVPDRRIEIKIEHLSGGIANVTCLCHRYVDLLQLIRMPQGWRIVTRSGDRDDAASQRTGNSPTPPMAISSPICRPSQRRA